MEITDAYNARLNNLTNTQNILIIVINVTRSPEPPTMTTSATPITSLQRYDFAGGAQLEWRYGARNIPDGVQLWGCP